MRLAARAPLMCSPAASVEIGFDVTRRPPGSNPANRPDPAGCAGRSLYTPAVKVAVR